MADSGNFADAAFSAASWRGFRARLLAAKLALHGGFLAWLAARQAHARYRGRFENETVRDITAPNSETTANTVIDKMIGTRAQIISSMLPQLVATEKQMKVNNPAYVEKSPDELVALATKAADAATGMLY